MNMTKEYVILVDQNDNPMGSMEKLQAHIGNHLHRAFSIFIFNDKNELLLQQRALTKYHSGGLWSNTCCGHPRPDENTKQAASRRLMEEMGFTCDLKKQFDFVYQEKVNSQLTEHEFDHVFTGQYNQAPNANPCEVKTWRYVSESGIEKELKENPDNYSSWFKLCYKKVFGCVKKM